MDASSNLLLEERASRLRLVLAEIRVSQARFAEQIGVSQTFVSAVASGRSQPSVQMVAGMREAYGISADWFILGYGEMRANPPAPSHAKGDGGPIHDLVDRVLASGDPGALQRLRGYLEALAEEAVPIKKRA